MSGLKLHGVSGLRLQGAWFEALGVFGLSDQGVWFEALGVHTQVPHCSLHPIAFDDDQWLGCPQKRCGLRL